MSERVTRRKLIVQRLAFTALVGLVAFVFLSSSLLAAVIAGVALVAVLVDTLALSRLAPHQAAGDEAMPRKITVDLSRRS